MKESKKDFRTVETKAKVKDLIKIANEKKLIKSHILAYKTTPVELGQHKGKVSMYKS